MEYLTGASRGPDLVGLDDYLATPSGLRPQPTRPTLGGYSTGPSMAILGAFPLARGYATLRGRRPEQWLGALEDSARPGAGGPRGAFKLDT
jgi:hypothetical protein